MPSAPPARASLWVEIALSLGLLTVAVAVLDAGVFHIATRYVLGEATADLAESAGAALAGELGATDEEGWRRVIDAYRRAGIDTITVWSPEGERLAGADQGAADAVVRRTVATREASLAELDDTVRVVVPVGSGRPRAVVELRYPRARVERPAWGVIVVHAMFSAGIIGIFGYFLFRRNVVDPIRRIGEATQAIAGGKFGTPVPADAPAELAELAEHLNLMSEALAAYRARTAEQLASLATANDDLRRTQDALVRSEKLASVGRLAAGLAHELGNPLAAVRGYVEILAGNPAHRDAGDIAHRAQVEVERMHSLLRNLLDFARADETEPGDVDLVQVIEEGANTVRHQVSFRGVELSLGADPVPHVRGEVTKLHQVLVNLLLNAADAGARRIEMGARVDGNDVLLSVVDDGEGIDPAHLSRLFEPFFTTRPPGRGTGLGLAIAHRVVEQHGGRIEVQSERGRGSCFTLRLPASR
ncbi:MAG: HAMP domain-containing histidine kinase [Deltaproteobacteria bacterium]|nr:HAMP domain-containing histidine kinase [Deltaproteobacteria bacterium]